jgi:hypothetical protein
VDRVEGSRIKLTTKDDGLLVQPQLRGSIFMACCSEPIVGANARVKR